MSRWYECLLHSYADFVLKYQNKWAMVPLHRKVRIRVTVAEMITVSDTLVPHFAENIESCR